MLTNNLKGILDKEGITLQELADRSNLPLETIRNLCYRKVKDPKVSTLLAISKALDVSINYLMGDTAFHPDEIEIIQSYRKCGIHGRSLIRFVAQFECKAAIHERNAPEKHRISCLIPIGDITDGAIYNSCDFDYLYTDVEDAYMAVEITTNQFTPSYCKGDRILLSNRFPETGERAIFVDRLKCYLRKFEESNNQYILHGLNGRGKDIVLQRTDEIDCVGTCIGVLRA